MALKFKTRPDVKHYLEMRNNNEGAMSHSIVNFSMALEHWLFVHSCLYLAASIGQQSISSYNLALYLFGIFSVHHLDSSEPIKYFYYLSASSVIVDIAWLAINITGFTDPAFYFALVLIFTVQKTRKAVKTRAGMGLPLTWHEGEGPDNASAPMLNNNANTDRN
ncbi:hypothetical protein O9G_001051 [Rozella allomycis CSF55]|uniref:Uncharacterized protein n=1 Tax=Rozella allomycis (strain CSF55) TaxID=988480 RepID=A0A075AR12_ROZAC|nr:hypothetical protein O9G_001051 [Rozella allomycis CSF55]|eukprot:EPZ31140.1 hypothetical protein O9G_001051 [Rozella allomycis CSF55]